MNEVSNSAVLKEGEFQPVTGQAGKVRVKCACGREFVTTKNLKGLPNRTDCKACAAIRLGEARVSKCLHDIKLVGNLASGQYEFEENHKTMIISALQDAINLVANQFNKVVKTEKQRFSLTKATLAQIK